MKIGIIIHSHTGNTYSVAQKLQEKLLSTGHTVNLERIWPIDENQTDPRRIQLKTVPDIGKYDALVFGCPVRGFTLSPVLAAFLSSVASLQGKKVAIIVTEFFPSPKLGGNQTVARIKNICESKGAAICGTGIVIWSSRRRNEMITEAVGKIVSLF